MSKSVNKIPKPASLMSPNDTVLVASHGPSNVVTSKSKHTQGMRPIEDYAKSKKSKAKKSKCKNLKIKFSNQMLKSSKTKRNDNIKQYMKKQWKKRKHEAKAETLKLKRESIKMRNQLNSLNNYIIKNNKVSDRSYNGAVPMNISRSIKHKKKNRQSQSPLDK